MKDECTNCGAWKGLHHYETNQCPRNGQEAPLGKLQEWDNTVYQEVGQNAGENYVEVLLTQVAEQAATIACLTAAHEMQGESLVVLPRWMVSNMEDKLKAQAAEIARLTDKLIPTYAEVEPK